MATTPESDEKVLQPWGELPKRSAFHQELLEEIDESVTVQAPFGECHHGFPYGADRICNHR